MNAADYWIVGAGGHARVVANLLERKGCPASGCIDPYADDDAKRRIRIPIVSGHEDLMTSQVRLLNGLGSVSKETVQKRKKAFDTYRSVGFTFETVVDPTASLAGRIQLGEGAQVLLGACVQTDVRIGENSIINTRVSVDHDCWIGSHVHIAPGATLSGAVRVEDEVHIGTGATVVQGVRIGKCAFIAAGAVVVRDVGDGEIITGVPGVKHV